MFDWKALILAMQSLMGKAQFSYFIEFLVQCAPTDWAHEVVD